MSVRFTGSILFATPVISQTSFYHKANMPLIPSTHPREIVYNTCMATFNTASELIQILRDDEQLREDMRQELLPRELRDLPAVHATLAAQVQAFVVATNERIEASEREIAEHRDATDRRIQEHREATDRRIEASEREIAEHKEATDRRIEASQREIAEHKEATDRRIQEHREATDRRIEASQREMQEFRNNMDRMHAETQRDIRAIHQITRELQRSFGDFKGNYAESAARKQAFSITTAFGRKMGQRLGLAKMLNYDDLLQISSDYGDDLDIPDNELDSFHESDLMILAADRRTGEPVCYIAVETSYTCDRTDTDRAIAHANLLRKFTQLPAYAAIAGIHRDDEIMHIIHKGEVFWFELDYGRFVP